MGNHKEAAAFQPVAARLRVTGMRISSSGLPVASCSDKVVLLLERHRFRTGVL